MPRPFILLSTSTVSARTLASCLETHPGVEIRSGAFGAESLPGGEAQTDDNRVRFLRRLWLPFRDGGAPPDGKARGITFRATAARVEFERPQRLVRVARQYDPAVIVLRHENLLEQTLSEMDDLPGTGARDLEELRNAVLTEHRDYRSLDQMAEAFGPVLEVMHDELREAPDPTLRQILRHIGADPDAWSPEAPPMSARAEAVAAAIAEREDLRQLRDEIGQRDLI